MLYSEVKDLGTLGDNELVQDGFVCARGFTGNYKFLERAYLQNPFFGDVDVPIMHFLKVHEDNPIRIAHYSSGRTLVAPEEDFQRGDFLHKIYYEREKFDLSSFMKVPYWVGEDVNWERILFEKGDCLLYFEGGNHENPQNFEAGSIEPQRFSDVSRIESSEILPSFHAWFLGCPTFLIHGANGSTDWKSFSKFTEKELASVLFRGMKRLRKNYLLD